MGIAIVAGVIVLIVAGIVGLYALQAKADRERRQSLLAKYGDPTIVDHIIRKVLWVGETGGQLVDSLGRPADIDQKVLKTKSKEIWKYAHRGGNRFGLRITIENGFVVGWDEKL